MKISIVTPAFNSARFIQQTLHSVVSQKGDFSIEYIIVDNDSSDETRDIVEQLQQQLSNNTFAIGCNSVVLTLLSEKDTGMYDAINKGFKSATGDIYAWINSDDIYLPGAFHKVQQVFSQYDDINWLKGITSYINSDSAITRRGHCHLYRQDWIRHGVYGRDFYFIQQDSVFWRPWLWEKAGGVDSGYLLAGDYDLWVRFAAFAPLVSVNAELSCFRQVDGQLSQNIQAYEDEVSNNVAVDNAHNAKFRFFIRYISRLPNLMARYFYDRIFPSAVITLITFDQDAQLIRSEGDYYALNKKIDDMS